MKRREGIGISALKEREKRESADTHTHTHLFVPAQRCGDDLHARDVLLAVVHRLHAVAESRRHRQQQHADEDGDGHRPSPGDGAQSLGA